MKILIGIIIRKSLEILMTFSRPRPRLLSQDKDFPSQDQDLFFVVRWPEDLSLEYYSAM